MIFIEIIFPSETKKKTYKCMSLLYQFNKNSTLWLTARYLLFASRPVSLFGVVSYISIDAMNIDE